MARNGQFGVAGVDSQSCLQCLEQRANLFIGELQAGVLSTKDISGLACLRPWCVVVAVMGTFNRRP